MSILLDRGGFLDFLKISLEVNRPAQRVCSRAYFLCGELDAGQGGFLCNPLSIRPLLNRAFWHANRYCTLRFFVATMSQENARKWILIVDDDSSVRLMLARVLSNEGYGVLTAAGGVDALDLAATMAFDLVLLDLNMPGTNGWETLEKLDAKKLAPPPPVIIITARPNQQAAGREAGVEAVLEKPLDFPRLIQTVSRVLAKAVNSNNAA